MPDTDSSTTPDSSASSCWSWKLIGPIFCEKRVAATLSSGSAPSASNASVTDCDEHHDVTATRIIRLAAVSGASIRNSRTIWMSVFARAMSWPVCASSWNAKCSRLEVREQLLAQVGLDPEREPERAVAPQAAHDRLERTDHDHQADVLHERAACRRR